MLKKALCALFLCLTLTKTAYSQAFEPLHIGGYRIATTPPRVLTNVDVSVSQAGKPDLILTTGSLYSDEAPLISLNLAIVLMAAEHSDITFKKLNGPNDLYHNINAYADGRFIGNFKSRIAYGNKSFETQLKSIAERARKQALAASAAKAATLTACREKLADISKFVDSKLPEVVSIPVMSLKQHIDQIVNAPVTTESGVDPAK